MRSTLSVSMYLYSEWLELFHTRIYRMGAPGPKYEHRLVVVKIASKTLLVSPATATCQRPQRHHKAQLGVPSRRGRLATVPTPPVRILSGIGPPGPPYGSHCGVVCPHSPFTEFVRPCVSLVPLSGVAVRPISTLCCVWTHRTAGPPRSGRRAPCPCLMPGVSLTPH